MKCFKPLLRICSVLSLLILVSCGDTISQQELDERRRKIDTKTTDWDLRYDKYKVYELCELWDESYKRISKKGQKKDRAAMSETLIRKGHDPLLCKRIERR